MSFLLDRAFNYVVQIFFVINLHVGQVKNGTENMAPILRGETQPLADLRTV